MTLTLSGQTGGTFSANSAGTNGIETLNIVSSGSKNTVALGDEATATITKVTVSGDQAAVLTEAAADPADAVTTFDASAATGACTYTTGTAARDMTITGGSGDDTITVGGTTFTAADVVDGGAGSDTLSIGVTGAQTQALLAKVTNVEALALDWRYCSPDAWQGCFGYFLRRLAALVCKRLFSTLGTPTILRLF